MKTPSLDEWIEDAKKSDGSALNGMYLFHNGIVRSTSKAFERGEIAEKQYVKGMNLSYDSVKLEKAKQKALSMPGISYVRVWINSGLLNVGDDIMLVLVGGNIRFNVINGLETLVQDIKSNCIVEQEIV